MREWHTKVAFLGSRSNGSALAKSGAKDGEKLFEGFGKLKFTTKHIKALLRSPQMRERIVGRIGKQGLVAADVDGLSPSDFDALCDAARQGFGNGKAPIVKTYWAKGPEGVYPIEIIGVRGAYMVCSSEFDNNGTFGTFKEAEGYIGLNWWGEGTNTSRTLGGID